jgi:hypothetical protein
MSAAKRTGKGKAGDATRVDVASRAGHGGAKGDSRTEKNFVPVEMIARKPASMMQELFLAHEGKVERVFKDDAGRALFALIQGSDGEAKAQVSGELRDRMRRLARYGLPDEAQELASAFKRLNGLPANTDSLVYRGELDASARLNLAIILQSFRRGLGDSLQEIERLRAKMWQRPLSDKKAVNAFKNLRAELKRRLEEALHIVLTPSVSPTKMKSDSPSFSVPWGLFGVPEPMHASLPAIIHARRFVENKKRLPTKTELRDTLEGEYKADISRWKRMNQKEKMAVSTWSGIWKEAGLAGLKKKAGDATSAKKGRKR